MAGKSTWFWKVMLLANVTMFGLTMRRNEYEFEPMSTNPLFGPPTTALIDVGALVTGFSNEQVAAFLLAHGLPHCKGCVFVDEASGNSLILQRGGAVLELRQCGIAPAERFTYFDQVRAKRAY